MIPFSDEISDYDMDGDKLITYHEFEWSVLRSVNLEDPNELWEPFANADLDGNKVLNAYNYTIHLHRVVALIRCVDLLSTMKQVYCRNYVYLTMLKKCFVMLLCIELYCRAK